MTIRHLTAIVTLTAAIQPAFAGSSIISADAPAPADQASLVARADDNPAPVFVSPSVIAMGVPAAPQPDETITVAAVPATDPLEMDMEIRGGLDEDTRSSERHDGTPAD